MGIDVEPQESTRGARVHGTHILTTDTRQQYREKLARITLDSMVQFVGLLDAHGTVLEINKVALDGVGINLSEVEGKPFWTTFWWQVSEEINAGLRAGIERAARGELVRWDTPIYGRAGGTETIIIDASLCPVVDDSGKVVFICAEGRDITQKKAQEREIAQKNVELQGLLERIRELDEIKTQFFANVSHELRTPLALIIGPAQRLIDDVGAMTPEQRRDSAGVIARNARVLLKHVNDLLDLSKLEAGKLTIELQDADVPALVRLTASHFDVLAQERAIAYRVEAPAEIVSAVDREKLERVLMNLLSNAFKFAPDGGRISCSVTATDRELAISVDDSGPGVKPELRRAIFERFRQGDGGSNRQFGGTGLGLAIAKEFVEMHRGSLEILDSPLGGARFRVTLPRQRLSPVRDLPVEIEPTAQSASLMSGIIEELRPAAATRREAPIPTPRPGAATILVVEDNLDMNRFVADSLRADHQVICAFDGRQGLEKALALRPALIVADIMMPVMSGADMVAEIRRHPELDDIDIVMLSAKADEDLKIQLLERGAQDFVTKPFSEKDLQVRVRNLLTARQTRQALRDSEARTRAADRRKDEFLAMLGHELRNPLAPIMTALQLMDLRGEKGSTKERQVIDRQVQHLSRLVDDLLDVARVTRGKIQVTRQRINLAQVVEKAVEMASPLFEQKGHRLDLAVERQGLTVDGDPGRLAQVIANLLTNAAKFTDPGGSVVLSTYAKDDRVIVSVKDDGQGITPELLDQVFDLFVQAQRTSERAQGGLGIGLALVRSLVELHDGRVFARSAGTGKGSEFVIELPGARGEIDPGASPDRLDLVERPRLQSKILLVDDNEDAAEVLAETLNLFGHDVLVAHDGPQALAAAETFRPRVVLLDIGLPVMDGYEVARRLREVWGDPSIRFVAITGYGQEADKEEARAAGFGAHLVKPVDIDKLAAMLDPKNAL
ncbi:MAG TPA: ATP-binding protein [Polyangia bacterium]